MLKRVVGPIQLALYGIGTMIGAGIYVLSGDIVQMVGTLSIFVFLFTGFAAALTAYSYVQLSRWYPLSAGESWYVHKAFGRVRLSQLVGGLVVASGVVSASTLVRGIYEYVTLFVSVSMPVVILVAIILMVLLCIRGISESMWVMSTMTVVEILGVLWAISTIFPLMSQGHTLSLWPVVPENYSMIIPAIFLSFYAFIGFEDIVNLSEEVKKPEKNIGIATFSAMFVTTLLYVLVCVALLLAFVPSNFPETAPLTSLLLSVYPNMGGWMSCIAMIAILNGALVQLIMASRVLYGMSSQGILPKTFGYVHNVYQTPVVSIVIVGVIILALAQLFPVKALATVTTFFLLVVFCLVNVALILIAHRENRKINRFFPLLGALICVSLLFSYFV